MCNLTENAAILVRVEGQQETLQEFQNPLDGFGGPVDSGENMNDILDSEHVSTGESGTLSGIVAFHLK